MDKARRNAAISFAWWIGLACVGGVGATLGLSSTQIPVAVKAERTFELRVDMDSFRKILVRNNATEAILNHGGMKLLNESTESLDIDLKNDARPLRNFLRGKSKANVSAIKHLKVQLNDPQINSSELFLTQECLIQPEIIHIVTTADAPSGNLTDYSTSLEAVKGASGTIVSLNIEMTVDVKVARIFQSQATVRVEQAANKTLEEQEEALRSLVKNVTSPATFH